MTMHTQLQQQTSLSSPIDGEDNNNPAMTNGIHYGELWRVIRGVLVVWAVGVWLLLVMMPGIDQITNAASAMLHVPHMFMGLGLVGAIFASYSLRSDGHMLWFLGVLLLLAGWI